MKSIYLNLPLAPSINDRYASDEEQTDLILFNRQISNIRTISESFQDVIILFKESEKNLFAALDERDKIEDRIYPPGKAEITEEIISLLDSCELKRQVSLGRFHIAARQGALLLYDFIDCVESI